MNNINFELEKKFVGFSFTDRRGRAHNARLILPLDTRGEDTIDGKLIDGHDDCAIKTMADLHTFFYSQFTSKPIALASIAAQFEVCQLIHSGCFFVAFSAEKAVILREMYLEDFDYTFYFEAISVNNEINRAEYANVVNDANTILHAALGLKLQKGLDQFLRGLFFTNECELKLLIGEHVNKFMLDQFKTPDYMAAPIAAHFYNSVAAPIAEHFYNSVSAKIFNS